MPRKQALRTDGGTVGRTVVRTVERTDDGTETEPEASVREMEAYENVERIRTELGDSEGYVLLARRLPNGTLATLAKINATIFDVDYIIKKFGGGTYSARFFKSGVAIDDGGFLGSVPFLIDPSVQPEPEAAPVVTHSGGNAPSWLAASLDKMSEAIKVLAERKPEPPPAPPDPMAMIEKLAVTMRALAPAPVTAQQGPNLKDQLDLIKSVVEVGTSIVEGRGEGGSSSGDAYMSAISKLADPIVELVKSKAQQEALRGVPRRPALPPPTTGPVPSQPEPVRHETHMNWLAEIQRWMPMIVKRQQKGASAESTAFFVLDELTDGTLAALAEFMAKPDADVQLQQVLPAELKTNPAWLAEFLQAVRDYLFAEDDDADQDEVLPVDLATEADARLAKLRDKPTVEVSEGPPPQTITAEPTQAQPQRRKRDKKQEQ